jgi:hypothetical protein
MVSTYLQGEVVSVLGLFIWWSFVLLWAGTGGAISHHSIRPLGAKQARSQHRPTR